MKPASLLPICGVTMLLCVSVDLRAQNATDGELAAAGFLVGTWQCSHTVGDFAGTYTTTISSTLENRWFSYVLPGSSATAAVYTRRSDTEFTVDGPTYPQNGRPVTEHHRCLKAT